MKTDKKEGEKKFSHRSINLKIDTAKLSDQLIEKLDEDIEKFKNLHTVGVNRYVRLPDQKTKTLNEEAKKLRKELKVPGYISGTFVDLAIGAKGAESYVRQQRDAAIRDILHRDSEVKKIEKDNPNLIKLKSAWFNPAKNASGICTVCGRDGKIVRRANEKEYKDEQLCEVCEVDFFTWRESLMAIKRKYILKNYVICKEIGINPKYELSQGFLKEIARFEKPVEVFKKTVSNYFKIKGGQLKINWETRMATMTLSTAEKIQVEFLGDYYYENFPQYGLDSDILKYKKLITDYLNNGGYSFLIRKFKDGNYQYYLSIPTRYPIVNKEKIEGCILVSQRRVLLYINGDVKFMELYNPYIKKRIYGGKQKEVQDQNKKLCICDWNRIPKKNHMFLSSLKKKLGFGWIDEHEVTVTKSEDGNKVIVKDDHDENKMIEISINRDTKTAELISGDISQTLHIVEREKKLDEEEGTYIKTDIYIEPKIPMPKKYAGGNLLKYTRHKNKETARQVVEAAKQMLNKEGSVVLVDYTHMHPEGEAIIPAISLNSQIENMLKYDSIYRGSINWRNLKVLTCPICHEVLPERENNKRYFIRDIFLSKWNSWICEDNNCRKKINNSLIGVARYIMNSDMKELLKTKKEKEEEIKEDAILNPLNTHKLSNDYMINYKRE